MDDCNFKLAEDLVHPSYIRLAQNSLNKRQKIVKELLSQRQLPQEGLDDLTIEYILNSLALMDSNNFDGKVGVGERESRIYSKIVSQRHFHMGHGIGRSGDIMANQPKAAGSSLILQLTKYLTVSALRQLNYDFVKSILPLPLATGMALSLAFLTLHQMRPQTKYVIWSRIDQKTCLKSILTANLTPVVIELKQEHDSLVTNIDAIQLKIKELGAQNVLAVVTTTSCFAPRVPDKVDEVALLAKEHKIYHVVNNAYGIWCSKIAHSIKEAFRKGQCTVVVQSTDKNFMVPVGGSFIFTQDPTLLDKISGKYPGRASGSPIVDLFITLLSMGKKTIQELKAARKINFQGLLAAGKEFAQKHHCKILETPGNSISIAMHLKELQQQTDITNLGAILYSKRVMGHRILAQTEKLTKIGNLSFKNYGSHTDNYPSLPYITFACAVGTQTQQIKLFFDRLGQSWKEMTKKINKKQKNISKQTSAQKVQKEAEEDNTEKKEERTEYMAMKKQELSEEVLNKNDV